MPKINPIINLPHNLIREHLQSKPVLAILKAINLMPLYCLDTYLINAFLLKMVNDRMPK